MKKTALHMSIHEGWNRQIRRMFAKYGFMVIGLDRIEFAGLTHRGLPRGRWRFIKKNELAGLFRLANQHKKNLEKEEV
jgi:23S rRNA pseudouridine2605 synthase